MSMPLLATKLYTPPQRPNLVLRPRLVERLNDGPGRKLTLISAPAGFGKTTLICEGIGELGVGGRAPKFAWLSLDESDNDLTRFLTYCIAALQTVDGPLGEALLVEMIHELSSQRPGLVFERRAMLLPGFERGHIVFYTLKLIVAGDHFGHFVFSIYKLAWAQTWGASNWARFIPYWRAHTGLQIHRQNDIIPPTQGGDSVR